MVTVLVLAAIVDHALPRAWSGRLYIPLPRARPERSVQSINGREKLPSLVRSQRSTANKDQARGGSSLRQGVVWEGGRRHSFPRAPGLGASCAAADRCPTNVNSEPCPVGGVLSPPCRRCLCPRFLRPDGGKRERLGEGTDPPMSGTGLGCRLNIWTGQQQGEPRDILSLG